MARLPKWHRDETAAQDTKHQDDRDAADRRANATSDNIIHGGNPAHEGPLSADEQKLIEGQPGGSGGWFR